MPMHVTLTGIAGVGLLFRPTNSTVILRRTSTMKRQIFLAAIAVASAAGYTACGSESVAVVPPAASVTYVSNLNSANENNAANKSTATGTATYTLTGNSLAFTVSVSGLTGPATASHIHVGAPLVNGNVLQGFVTGSVATGNLTSGTIDLSQPVTTGNSTITGDSLKVLLNNGNAYTNVHTSAFAGGEIRGQIVKQ